MAFRTTRWSLVVAAGKDARSALSDLVEAYWYPLYAFARRRGAGVEAAQDQVQSFFASLIEKRFLRAADPARGRFRTFLLTAFKRHAAKAYEKEQAKKRGGGRVHLPLDFERGEERYRREPADDRDPERLYERAWALSLLDRVLRSLGDAYQQDGRGEVFEVLRSFLVAGSPPPSLSDAQATLGLGESAVKVALHRLRRRYRDRLRAEIAETVEDPAHIDDEIHHLMDGVR